MACPGCRPKTVTAQPGPRGLPRPGFSSVAERRSPRMGPQHLPWPQVLSCLNTDTLFVKVPVPGSWYRVSSNAPVNPYRDWAEGR